MAPTIKTGAMIMSVTSWDKDYDITIDGQEMRVILHWDDHDGFEMTWLDKEGRFISSPDCIDEINDFCLKLSSTRSHSQVQL